MGDGLGGISGGAGHIGEAASVRTANTLSSIGSSAFNVAMSGATVAAGAFGGPTASAAVNSLKTMAGGIGGGGQGSGSANAAVDRGVSAANAGANASANAAADQAAQQSDQQMQLFRLQSAMNFNSEQFKALTNVANAKHETANASIDKMGR